MIHTIRHCLLLFLLAVAIGCQQEELRYPTANDVVEGEKTTLLLSIKSNDPIQVSTRASLSESKEREINSIAIFIFNSNGEIVNSTFHANVLAHVCDISGNLLNSPLDPDGGNYFPVETLTGNDRRVYVIANYEVNIVENLKAVSSETDLKNLIFGVVANPLIREFGVAKVGTIASTPVRHGTPIQVDLSFVSAKITLNVINNYSSFEVEGWTVENIPIKSYVFERQPRLDDPSYHDAIDVSNDGDYFHDFADQRFLFESTPNGGALLGTFSTVFYMVENRRGKRIQREDPPAGWPYGTELDGERDNYQLKTWFAPKGATFVKIYGKLTDAFNKKQLVVIKHYLGANSEDDYNINRATHYTYNISINTLGKIKIDTNVEMSSSQLRIDPPADATSLDGHFGFRMFRIHSNEITDSDYSVSAEVLQAINSSIPAPWLNLAITPVTMHHLKSSDSNIGLWQQLGGNTGSYVRPRFIPNRSTRTALQAAGSPYVPPTGVVIGSAEYPDDDTSLPFEKAIHRMCKKITNLPTYGNTSGKLTDLMNIMLYADEYPFDDRPTAPAYREAVIRFTISKNGVDLEYIHFPIRQYPPHRFTQIPGQTNAILVERVEEYEHMLMPTMPITFQMLVGMQWGPFNLTSANNDKNGYDNTLHGVYTNINNRTADFYQTKYGSEGGGWSIANNGVIVEPGTPASTSNPYFQLPSITDPNHLNVIYNTTAARYCHEKNWDINGNGNIDPNETFWYLPSTLELQQFWTLHELLNLKPEYYWSSVQADENNAYAFSMLSSPSDPHLSYNGVQQKYKKSNLHNIIRPRVRCVRRAPSGTTPIAPLVLHRSDNTSIVDCSILPGSVHTSQSKMGITQGNPGALHQANEKIFKKFEVQRTQPAPVDYYSLHLGNGVCDQTKGWRLPTQREMLLIWMVKDKLEANSAFAMFVTDNNQSLLNEYWTLNRDLRSRYIVDFSSGLSKYEAFQGINIQHQYRCIKEIQ